MKLKVRTETTESLFILLRDPVSAGLGSVVPAAGRSGPAACLKHSSGKPAEVLQVKSHSEVQTNNMIKPHTRTLGYEASPQCDTPGRGTRR